MSILKCTPTFLYLKENKMGIDKQAKIRKKNRLLDLNPSDTCSTPLNSTIASIDEMLVRRKILANKTFLVVILVIPIRKTAMTIGATKVQD